MNRAQRRAARYTKRGRTEHAARTEHICEHGNWMKTDGNGDPMCPHRCGFRPEDKTNQRIGDAIKVAKAKTGPTVRVFDSEWNELDLNKVTQRVTVNASAQ